ncbi:MAG: hypothetical protein J5798_00755 [Spirochaetaceae bacterium]|nr:hypothetical protein [Spirochaetaceae bacterium]
MSETDSKIVYNIENGVFGTVEYDKKTKQYKSLNKKGEPFKDSVSNYAFYVAVVKKNFPEESIYAAA